LPRPLSGRASWRAEMARAGRSNRRRADSAPPPNPHDRIIDAAFALLPTEGWRRLSLAAIAAAAELPILQVYRIFGSKQAVLCGFLRRIDEAVLAEPPAPEPDERPRDRLFDLLMRRFDALQPYKPGLDVLRRELRGDPVAAVCAATALLNSMRWMVEAAEISTAGVRGAVAVKLATAAHLSAARVWHQDDSPDLARTMAALDARLRRIEGWLRPARTARPARDPLPA
jgi:AcrR family transcriptional regulator